MYASRAARRALTGPAAVMLLNPTYGKRGLHPTRDTCGPGGAWQSSCRHHWPCAYPRRRHDGLEWSCCPADVVARLAWRPTQMLRRLRQKPQRRTWSLLFSHVNLQEEERILLRRCALTHQTRILAD